MDGDISLSKRSLGMGSKSRQTPQEVQAATLERLAYFKKNGGDVSLDTVRSKFPENRSAELQWACRNMFVPERAREAYGILEREDIESYLPVAAYTVINSSEDFTDFLEDISTRVLRSVLPNLFKHNPIRAKRVLKLVEGRDDFDKSDFSFMYNEPIE